MTRGLPERGRKEVNMLRNILYLILDFGIMELILIILVIINISTFLLYAIDKRRIGRRIRPISEEMLILSALALGGIGAFGGIFLLKNKKKRMLKFRIVAVLGVIIAVIPIIHIAHGLTLDRIVNYMEVDFTSENWPASLDGYRIAFMTDFHSIADEDMAEIVAELNQKNIDLLLLGGDFSSDVFSGGVHYQGTLREIAQTITTDGIFGVDGNHDYYSSLFRAKVRYGITPLDNSGMQIREGFYLAGVQDMLLRNPSISQAVAEASIDDFILLVSHNPDVTMRQPTAGIDLIVTGHTHGGQITFFGFPFFLLHGSVSAYRTRFAHGFAYSADDVPVFTSRGIGDYYRWPRIFARPEVVIFTINSE